MKAGEIALLAPDSCSRWERCAAVVAVTGGRSAELVVVFWFGMLSSILGNLPRHVFDSPVIRPYDR